MDSPVISSDVPRTPRRRWPWGLLASGAVVIAASLLARAAWTPGEASAQTAPAAPRTANPNPPPAATPGGASAAQPQPAMAVVAVVNGEEVSRNDLARQCLWHFGEEVLESVVNKQLIEQECAKRNIVVTSKDVEAEMTRMAKSFKLGLDQWLGLLKSERNVTAHQYASDIVWPKLALERLAAGKLQVTPGEIQAAYESEYGPAVQARLIVCDDAEKARVVQATALANPDDFGNLAKEHSVDASASSKGLIQPIRKHLGPEVIEVAAFSLQPGQVSDVLQVDNKYIILKCEQVYPANKVPFDKVQQQLSDALKDRKLGQAADDLLRDLQTQSQVENIFNDEQKRAAHPGVAAIINGRQVTVRELSEECITRHGIETLEGVISRKLLEQACKERNLTVTQQEVQEEIARAAKAMGSVKDGQPDVQGWLKKLADEQGIATDLYIHDTVWPTVALKKLVGVVKVTDEDLQKGFDANYGPRVRCRAIVLNNQRRAQEVWEMAQANPTVEYFGELAEQYSIEAGSRALKGEVPPIQKWCGQPNLEQEAFSLKPGELSAIVQVGDKYVILLCEGRTQPNVVNLADVRELLIDDLQEKKLRISMAEEFNRLQQEAQIDNMLAGTSQSPPGTADPLNPLPPSTPEDRTARGPRQGTAAPPAAAPSRVPTGPRAAPAVPGAAPRQPARVSPKPRSS